MKVTSFATVEDLDKHLASRGYVKGELAKLIESGSKFPEVKNLVNKTKDWYPLTVFKKYGKFNALATMKVSLGFYNGASNPKDAKIMCDHNLFMTSYREIFRFVFIQLTQREGTIALPGGGFPYYLPRDKEGVIIDTDSSLNDWLDEYPNCTAILGSVNGDIFNMTGLYDTICIMGLIFSFSKEKWSILLKRMHNCLNPGGLLYLNFILADEEQGKEEDGSSQFPRETFKNAMLWNMMIINELNKSPTFNATFVTRNELREMCKTAGFIVKQLYTGTLHVHGIAILEKK